MSLLLVALLLVGFVAALVHSGNRLSGRAPPLFLAAAYGCPALLLLLPFWLNPPEPRLRLALLGVGFRAQADVPLRVSIGGDPRRHDLWVARLPGESAGDPAPAAGWLELSTAPTGARRQVSLWVDSTRSAGLLATGKEMRPVGGIALRDGDRVVVAGRSWEVRGGGFFGSPGALAEPSGRLIELPGRTTQLPLLRIRIPMLGGLSITRMTFPIAALDPTVPRSEPVSERGFVYAETRFTCREGARVLCPPQLWLVPGRVGAEVYRGPTQLPASPRREVASGDAVYVLAFPRRWARGEWSGGAVDLRSFRVEASDSGIVAAYHTPELQTLSHAQVAALSMSRPPPAQAGDLAVSLSFGDWGMADRALHLRHASQGVGSEAVSILLLPAGLWRGGHDTLTVTTPRGNFETALGRPAWLGGRRAALVQFDILRAPWALALLALLLAVPKALAAHRARLPLAAAGFAGALETIVVLRLLIAFRTWAMPPHAAEAYALALVAWALLPWAFLAAAMTGAGRTRLERRAVAVPILCGLAWSATWSLVVGGGGAAAAAWLGCHAALAALVVSTALVPRTRATVLSRISRATGKLGERGPWFWVTASMAFTAARVVLALAGARESINPGVRIALSLFHIPAALLLEAAVLGWFWRRAEQGTLRYRDVAVVSTALLAGVWVLPSLWVSDSGLALLNVPVFLAALALVAGAAVRTLRLRSPASGSPVRRTLRLGVGALGVYVFLVAVPLAPRLILTGLATLFPEKASVFRSDRNYLRVLGFASPDELERVGRRSSEELVIMSAVLDRYTRTSLTGRGYFASELSPHIASTSLREHAPAVFVSAEWGRSGITGLVLLYLAAGIAGGVVPFGWTRRRTSRRGFEWGMLEGCALMASLTFATASLYMLAANHGLVVFTGKNAYLLGMDSMADVLEVLALAVLAGVGFRALRKGEDLT